MPIRYLTLLRRPRTVTVQDDVWTEPPVTMQVISDEGQPVDTGLVDQFGTTIYRVPTRERMGF